LTIDTTVVLFCGVNKDSGIASTWLLENNNTPKNKISIAMAGTQQTLGYGSGELLRLMFKVRADAKAGAFSDIVFSEIQIDENTDITPTSSNGRISVTNPDILYGDVSGNNEVTIFDASKILQHVVGDLPLPDATVPNFVTEVADVSGNGSVSSYDAALVFQYSVGIISRFPVQGEIAPAKRLSLKQSVLSMVQGQDKDGQTTFYVTASNASGMLAGEFSILFDPLKADLTGYTVSSPVPGMSVQYQVSETEGKLNVAMAGNDDLYESEDAIILTIRGPSAGIEGTEGFQLASALINEGGIATNLPSQNLLPANKDALRSDVKKLTVNDIVVLGSRMILLNAGRTDAMVRMYDLKGRQVKVSTRITGSDITADLSNVAPSSYLVSITVNGSVVNRRILVRQ
jgi:hypothetical protein